MALLGSSALVARAQTAVTLAGSPSMVVSSAIAGAQPTPVTNTSSTYLLTGTAAYGTGLKVRAKLLTSLPSGVTITVSAAVGFLNSSSGSVTLTTSYQDILTSQLPSASAYTLTYTLSATTQASPMLQNVSVQYCVNSSNNC